MRYGYLCVLSAVLLSSGCVDAYSPVPEGVTPPPQKVMLPACKFSVDERRFARIITVLKQNGDVERANGFYARMRRMVEARVASEQPEAVARLKPALDAFFSGAEIEKQAVCMPTNLNGVTDDIAAWEAWSSDGAMRGIHARIMDSLMSEPKAPVEIDDARRSLLVRVVAATDARSMLSTLLSGQRQAFAITEAALDPASSMLDDIARNALFVTPPGEQEFIDGLLAPALSGVPDQDLVRFLRFAETNHGRSYYRRLLETYNYTATDWYERLGKLLATAVAAPPSAHDPEMAATKAAEARRLLDVVGTRVVFPEARKLLIEAERLDPGSAVIQTLLGRVAYQQGASRQFNPDRDRLRPGADDMFPQDATVFAEAEERLQRAIKADPKNAEAQLYLGYVRFKQSRDDEAASQFAIARKLDPDEPSLALFEGDLAYEQGRYREAERLYRQVLARPEGRAYNHYYALGRMLKALRKQDREAEFDAVAASQLRKSPKMWDFRFDEADRLIQRGASFREIRAMIDPVPDRWLWERKQSILLAAEIRRMHELPAASHAAAAKRVFEVAEDPMQVVEPTCIAMSRERIAPALIRASGDPGRFADALLACVMRQQDVPLGEAILPLIDDIDRPNPVMDGDTPLCMAVRQNSVRMIELLIIKAKANPGRVCAAGKTPRALLLERVAPDAKFGETFKADARAALAAFDRAAKGK